MARLVRKNFLLDAESLATARRLLGLRTESETVRAALDLVAFRHEAMRGYDQASGAFVRGRKDGKSGS